MDAKNKTAYFEWLRLFAAVAVVLMHTAAQRWYQAPIDTEAFLTLTRWEALVRWPVPVFVMITGAIFLPRKTALKPILTRYIPRMLLCYALWAGFYTRYRLSMGADPATAWQLFAAGQYHLWYLPFLCGVYLTLPFLQKIAEDEGLTHRLLWVSLAVGSLIPWGLDLTALLLPDWAGPLASLKGHLNFTFFLDLLAALVLGHRLHSRELPPRSRRILYGLGAICMVLTLLGTLHMSARTGTRVTLFFEHSSPLNLCTAAAIFVFAKYNLTRLPGWIGALASCSFGIYLSHALLLDHLFSLELQILTWDPARLVPVLAAMVFAVCALGTALIRAIPVIGKYLT